MYLEKRVKIRQYNYFVRIELEYKKDDNGVMLLKLKNFKDDYYDGGDFVSLIEEVEKNYTYEKAEKYDKNISYMAEVIYLYERIPFLIEIRDENIKDGENTPYSIGYISKEEIEEYIKLNNIKLNNSNFKLSDRSTWIK